MDLVQQAIRKNQVQADLRSCEAELRELRAPEGKGELAFTAEIEEALLSAHEERRERAVKYLGRHYRDPEDVLAGLLSRVEGATDPRKVGEVVEKLRAEPSKFGALRDRSAMLKKPTSEERAERAKTFYSDLALVASAQVARKAKAGDPEAKMSAWAQRMRHMLSRHYENPEEVLEGYRSDFRGGSSSVAARQKPPSGHGGVLKAQSEEALLKARRRVARLLEEREEIEKELRDSDYAGERALATLSAVKNGIEEVGKREKEGELGKAETGSGKKAPGSPPTTLKVEDFTLRVGVSVGREIRRLEEKKRKLQEELFRLPSQEEMRSRARRRSRQKEAGKGFPDPSPQEEKEEEGSPDRHPAAPERGSREPGKRSEAAQVPHGISRDAARHARRYAQATAALGIDAEGKIGNERWPGPRGRKEASAGGAMRAALESARGLRAIAKEVGEDAFDKLVRPAAASAASERAGEDPSIRGPAEELLTRDFRKLTTEMLSVAEVRAERAAFLESEKESRRGGSGPGSEGPDAPPPSPAAAAGAEMVEGSGDWTGENARAPIPSDLGDQVGLISKVFRGYEAMRRAEQEVRKRLGGLRQSLTVGAERNAQSAPLDVCGAQVSRYALSKMADPMEARLRFKEKGLPDTIESARRLSVLTDFCASSHAGSAPAADFLSEEVLPAALALEKEKGGPFRKSSWEALAGKEPEETTPLSEGHYKELFAEARQVGRAQEDLPEPQRGFHAILQLRQERYLSARSRKQTRKQQPSREELAEPRGRATPPPEADQKKKDEVAAGKKPEIALGR